MKTSRLIHRSLIHYWRTDLAVVAGIAVAVAVMSGALMVGRSVRGSLEDLLFERIGKTEIVVASERFINENIAQAFSSESSVCPIIYLQGDLIRDRMDEGARSRTRIHHINVYGIDDRFWEFHALQVAPFQDRRGAFVGAALARQLSIARGDALILQIESQQAIPKEWLYGQRDDFRKSLRLSCEAILPSETLGDFSLRPSQGEVYSVFVPISRLQKDLNLPSDANTILLSHSKNGRSSDISQTLARNLTLSDLGLHLKDIPSPKGFILESDSILVGDQPAQLAMDVAKELGFPFSPVYTYMANSIRAGGRSIPYSAITAANIGEGALTDIQPLETQSPPKPDSPLPPITLTDWARQDLGIDVGETVEVDYYIWQDAGDLATRSESFKLTGIVPIKGSVHTSLAPEIPGITESASMTSWDPPFPMDLERIRDKDEQYWERYRATPKAFVPLPVGQRLWKSRFGDTTSIRFTIEEDSDLEAAKALFTDTFLSRSSPESSGIAIRRTRETGKEASSGSTDFGEYFLYFSFFLIVSSILLSVLFFKLTVEQRIKDLGYLKVAGFTPGMLQRLFIGEGMILSVIGSAAGMILSIFYGYLMVHGLRTWWVGAVGTTRLSLHFSWMDLASGALVGVFIALGTIGWTLQGLKKISPRALMAGSLETHCVKKRRTRFMGTVAFAAAIFALALLVTGVLELVSQTVGFFVAGFLLLVSVLCATAYFLQRQNPGTLEGGGWWAIVRLGMRNAGYRPGRSLLCAALIASATFIIVSTEAFHRDPKEISYQRDSGTGGFPFVSESTIPVVQDPNSPAGREALALETPSSMDQDSVRFVSFRERPGDDTSCLNLYTPTDPKILGAPESFLKSGRFAFLSATAMNPEQERNPWLLLDTVYQDGAIAAIADANTIQYILHLSVGSDLTIQAGNGRDVRLRLSAALDDSIFQGGILISEKNFLKLFPDQEGYRFFLIDMPEVNDPELLQPFRESLAYWGIQLQSSRDLLASYHRVENTYLSTFQSLGTLGLILGTFGLATVLLRNVLERRSELALLRATGYRERAIAGAVLSENFLLLFWGAGSGIVCALLAIAPAVHSRGATLPASILGTVLIPVLVSGIVASLIAVFAVMRSPLLPSLRSE